MDAFRRVTERFVERSRSVSKSDDVLDLDLRHTAAAPMLRRIANLADHDPLYRRVALDSPIPDIVAELIGPALHIHHYRLVQWSAPNTSPAERRLLINASAAADTVSLMADTAGSPLYDRLVRGTPPRVARRTAGEMPLPPNFREGYTSIYELQRQGASVNP